MGTCCSKRDKAEYDKELYDSIALGLEEAVEKTYVADNSILCAQTKGVAYRHSRNMSDLGGFPEFVPWGESVRATTCDGEWLEVGRRLLPVRLQGVVVFRPISLVEEARCPESNGLQIEPRLNAPPVQAEMLPTPFPEAPAATQQVSPLTKSRGIIAASSPVERRPPLAVDDSVKEMREDQEDEGALFEEEEEEEGNDNDAPPSPSKASSFFSWPTEPVSEDLVLPSEDFEREEEEEAQLLPRPAFCFEPLPRQRASPGRADSDWFSLLMGFSETTPAETRRRVSVSPASPCPGSPADGQGHCLVMESMANGARYAVGRLDAPRLDELRRRGASAALPGRLTVANEAGEMSDKHAALENRHATFLVAPRFGDATDDAHSPSCGSACGACRGTCGACSAAVACGAAAVFREHFAGTPAGSGQAPSLELDAFADLCRELGSDCFEAELDRAENSGRLDALRGAVRVAVHEDVQVTTSDAGRRLLEDADQLVTQVFSVPCTSGRLRDIPGQARERMTLLALEASYEAALWAALLASPATRAARRRAGEPGARRVFLGRPAGDGCSAECVAAAMRRACEKFRDCSLDIRIVAAPGEFAVPAPLLQLERDWQETQNDPFAPAQREDPLFFEFGDTCLNLDMPGMDALDGPETCRNQALFGAPDHQALFGAPTLLDVDIQIPELDAPDAPPPPLMAALPSRHSVWRYQPFNGSDVDVRTEPRIDAPRTEVVFAPGQEFEVSEEIRGEDSAIYLRLADGSGWLFDRRPGEVMCTRAEDPSRVQLVVFDFDQTLSAIHVFKSLAGWQGGTRLPGPTASSELGQLRLVEQLDASEPFASAGGFATVAFGGHARCELLRHHLFALRRAGAEMVVCTKGLVGPAQWCLRSLGVLDLFTRVYGLTGDDYGTQDYDDQVCDAPLSDLELRLLGGEESAKWGNKADLIARLRKDRGGLTAEQVVLVEDDPEEIRKGQKVARTVFVSDGQGMTEVHLRELGCLVEHASSSWVYRPHNGANADIRAEPSVHGARTEFELRPSEAFEVSEVVMGPDFVTYLRLADDRGWFFDRRPGSTMCVQIEGDVCSPSLVLPPEETPEFGGAFRGRRTP